MGVKEVFVYLEKLGLLNVVIPFVIIFIVSYSLLNRVKLFKDNKINTVLATLVSFVAIAAADVVINVNLFAYYLVIAVFIIAAVFILIAMTGGKLDLMSDKKKKYFSWIVLVCIILLVIYALYRSGMKLNLSPVSFVWLNSAIPVAITILVFILIVWFVTSPGKKTAEKESSKVSAAKEKPSAAASETKKQEEQAKVKELPVDEDKKSKWEFFKSIKKPKDKGDYIKFN